jgi:putative CocE/NonD family hydrolase
MPKINGKLLTIAVCFLTTFFIISSTPLSTLAESVSTANKVSTIGQYRGYSEQIHPNVVRTSQYVAVQDGTKLAVDIYRPADNDGKLVQDPLPVVWELTPYGRDLANWYSEFVKYGYVLSVVDTRGRGASYGPYMGQHRRWEAWDGYDMTEWFAAQPWCDGNVGMLGCSYKGVVQLMIASTRPPHLKAIFSGCHDFQKYGAFYCGGMYQDVRWSGWAAGQEAAGKSFTVGPVDGDTELITCPVDGKVHPKMQCEAVMQHTQRGYINEVTSLASIPFYNMYSDMTKSFFWVESSVATYLNELNRSGVGIYLYGGWWDPFTTEQLLQYKNLKNSKIILTPTPHCQIDGPGLDFNIVEEHVRWFDYWLKGIENGITDEKPVAYYPVNTKDGKWRFLEDWPPPNAISKKYYLSNGPSGSVNSVNDGVLTTTAPTGSTDKDEYTVDFTCTSGLENDLDLTTRPEQTFINDRKGLTYTSAPLASDVEVTGQPIVHLWVSSTAADGDFFTFLEEVDDEGSHYIGFGCLRASNRAVRTPWYDNMGLPWHPGFKEDQKDLTPGEPTELVFDLAAISNIFKAGHRIRLTITGADLSQVAQAPKPSPPPTVRVYRNGVHASYITLPIMPAQ